VRWWLQRLRSASAFERRLSSIVTQLSKEYSTLGLLAFFNRVNPVLSAWLDQPTWTAEETALLCAGFLPPREVTDIGEGKHQEPSGRLVPIDSEEYLPSNRKLLHISSKLLAGKRAASPHDMVNVLRPVMRAAIYRMDQEDQEIWAEGPRAFGPSSFKDLEWLLVIGNAVGWQVPAIVPLSLLNGFRDQLTGHSASIPDTRAVEVQAKEIEQRKPRGRQSVPTTPAQRGYYTTEEVAGFLNLQPDTLNKYARESVHVEGYTPFKRQNGRAWQWRDAAQQALFNKSPVGQANAQLYSN